MCRKSRLSGLRVNAGTTPLLVYCVGMIGMLCSHAWAHVIRAMRTASMSRYNSMHGAACDMCYKGKGSAAVKERLSTARDAKKGLAASTWPAKAPACTACAGEMPDTSEHFRQLCCLNKEVD